MNYSELLKKFGSADEITRAALIVVGQFGRSLLLQARQSSALQLSVLCDLDVVRLQETCLSVGLDREDIVIAESLNAALKGIEAGKTVLTQDPKIAISAPVDVVVEATGSGEAGARNCLEAIEQGRHITLVTKETDSVVGPLLAARAARQGLVLSQVDGDQPSLLLSLISWARMLGLQISCAGKASEYDFVYDESAGVVHVEGTDAQMQLSPQLWTLDSHNLSGSVEDRGRALGAFPQRTPPDFCEMCIVANASGLRPDRPDFHAPVARIPELPELFRPQEDGGVLSRSGCLDIFNCFRRTDEASAAGGVFVVLKIPDAQTGALFRAKGMPTDPEGSHLLAYNPTHLLGIEAPLSIVLPHRLGLATGSGEVNHVCDVAMRANQDLPAGSHLTDHGDHHRRIAGIEAELLDYCQGSDTAPLPYFLAHGGTLTRSVKRGEIITRAHVQRAEGALLWKLRDEQDSLYSDLSMMAPPGIC